MQLSVQNDLSFYQANPWISRSTQRAIVERTGMMASGTLGHMRLIMDVPAMSAAAQAHHEEPM